MLGPSDLTRSGEPARLGANGKTSIAAIICGRAGERWLPFACRPVERAPKKITKLCRVRQLAYLLIWRHFPLRRLATFAHPPPARCAGARRARPAECKTNKTFHRTIPRLLAIIATIPPSHRERRLIRAKEPSSQDCKSSGLVCCRVTRWAGESESESERAGQLGIRQATSRAWRGRDRQLKLRVEIKSKNDNWPSLSSASEIFAHTAHVFQPGYPEAGQLEARPKCARPGK